MNRILQPTPNGRSGKSLMMLVLALLCPSMSCLAVGSYFVATTGADSNDGSETKPWKTIQKAADTVAAGDTVTVLAGNYASERVTVSRSGTSEARITYQAKGQVVMKGFKIIASHVTVRGFEIADTDYVRWHADASAGIYVKGDHVILENNYIHDAALEGIVLFGTPAEPAATSDCIVRNNRLFRNEMAGISVAGRNNLVEGNEIWGTVQYHPKVLAAKGPCSIGAFEYRK